MIFSSLTFLFYFLPLTLILYFLAPGIKFKNFVLLIASIIFYSWGEPIYILLMLVSTLNDYLFSNLIQRERDKYQSNDKDSEKDRNTGKNRERIYFILSLIVNLGLLGVFKYADFFIQTLNNLTGLSMDAIGLPLPIGISFYTFQTMSYTIDVYLGNVKAQRNILTLATYVCLFPQLIAGPIVRYQDIEKELMSRTSTLEDITDGLRRFMLGLSKKVLIANTMGYIVDQIYIVGNIPEYTIVLWIASFAYTFQIYFDFSGYSDMAIGLGRIFGFHFLENFNRPYLSSSMTEFWRRWHISLGTWFRDYVYIPLGGNRRHQYLNIAIVWFLTGMWHGAYLNYILWGLFHGFFLTVEKMFHGKINPPYILKRLITIFLIVIGFTIFRLEDMSALTDVIRKMFTFSPISIRQFLFEYNNILYSLPILIVATVLSFFVRDLGVRSIGRSDSPKHRNEVNDIAVKDCDAVKQNDVLGRSPDYAVNRDNGLKHRGAESEPAWKFFLSDVFLITLFGLSVMSIVGSGFNPFIYFRF